MTAENPEPTPEADTQPPRDAERWASRLSLVYQIARSVQTKLEMGDLLNSVVEAIHSSFGFYDVSLFLLDAEAEECVLVAQAGVFEATDIRGYRQKMGVGLVGWVAENGETILANDVRKDPRHLVAFEGESNILSELAVPIRLRDRTVGVINVQNREEGSFDKSDVMALETLADQIAQAIGNAQLFERTRLLRDLNRSIIDAMPSGLCVVDRTLEILYANPAFCALLRRDAAGLVGRDVREALAKNLLDTSPIEDALNNAIDKFESRVFADLTLKSQETEHAVNVRVAPTQMPEGTGALLVIEDVTQWRRAMDLAEERRGHLALIVRHVPIAVISFDVEGTLTYWGAGAEALFGRNEKEMVGRAKPYDLFEPPRAMHRLIEECAREGSSESELFVVHPQEGRIPALAVLGKLLDKDGHHAGYSAVALDIRERYRTREELVREKRKLDDVVGVIGAGLALIDREHKIIWANKTLQDWFGHGRQIEGMLCHQLYCRRDKECAICPSKVCFATASNSESEIALVRADGELRQYHHAVTPVIGPNGEVEQVLKLTLDVTDHTKKVYQLSRLRQLGELMQGLLDLDRLLHFVLTCVTAGQALGFNRAILMLIDADRNVIEGKMGVGPESAQEAARIWSSISEEAPTLEDLLARYKADEKRGVSAMDRIARQIQVPIEDRDHILSQCARGKKPLIVEDAESNPQVRDDLYRLMGARQFVLVPLIARNRPVGIIMADNLYSGRPISHEHVELLSMFATQAAIAIENAENYRNLQEEKQHLEKAYRDLANTQDKLLRSERLVAIGRMAAHMAHEIRNPLVTIGGFAGMISRNAGEERPNITRYAGIISSEVRRLENILARVMDFSKPPHPLLREDSFTQTLRATIDQFRDRAESQGVEIDAGLPDDVTLRHDPDQMKQVFINLIQNALDAMKDGGKLTVVLAMNAAATVVTFTNTGEPIRPEDVPSLFEPFFSTKPGGTGLGLAVSQKIVQEHGGDIRVNSTLTQGTRFIVTLPKPAQ